MSTARQLEEKLTNEQLVHQHDRSQLLMRISVLEDKLSEAAQQYKELEDLKLEADHTATK